MIDNIISHSELRISEMIQKFHDTHPKTNISIHIAPVINLEQMLLDNKINLAICFCHHKLETLKYTDFITEDHYLYCGIGHPAFVTDQFSDKILSNIENYDYVSRSYLEGGLPSLDLKFRIAAHADNIEALAILVLTGRYIAFLPEHYAMRWVERGSMRAIRPDRICQTARFSLVLPKVARPSRIVDAFVANFREVHSAAFV